MVDVDCIAVVDFRCVGRDTPCLLVRIFECIPRKIPNMPVLSGVNVKLSTCMNMMMSASQQKKTALTCILLFPKTYFVAFNEEDSVRKW